ncbi:uncharacterized protein BYT42DRAFT_22988 [Radiomyces spectabilis]|uniref:uncharacterized protein n=1 Tax=Radiomyces spectabilis TaxID=64574 RepID=UPI00221F6DDF|nr:uncharacterized protein BYT42DRAFT_22988 [Radiomyces spectabilis]KAI8393893.1 hypothetical protein BYT42DRAFT_22988 [Radiomyces spectabilis]
MTEDLTHPQPVCSDLTLPDVILALGPDERHTSPSPKSSKNKSSCGLQAVETDRTDWPCHKFILEMYSSYFSALFESEFREYGSSIVFLPRGILSALALEGILHIIYVDWIRAHPSLTIAPSFILFSEPSNHLEHLQDMYLAADYLGMPTIRTMLANRLSDAVHQISCYCPRCACRVPQLFSFTRTFAHTHVTLDRLTTLALQLLTGDPEKAIPTFWVQQELGRLLLLSPDLHEQMSQILIGCLNKCNAIETLHACYTALVSLDSEIESSPWHQPLRQTLRAVHFRVTGIIAANFNFYCSEYPTLLSCIDGINYSFAFLDYLLQQVLEEQMDHSNAGLLYQGIVRHLRTRRSVPHCMEVSAILEKARAMVVSFIAQELSEMRKLGTLNKYDTPTLEILAQGISWCQFVC